MQHLLKRADLAICPESCVFDFDSHGWVDARVQTVNREDMKDVPNIGVHTHEAQLSAMHCSGEKRVDALVQNPGIPEDFRISVENKASAPPI